MKRFASALCCLFAIAALSGMDCQGTMPPPGGDPNGDPPSDPDLVIVTLGADAVKDQLLVNGKFVGDEQGTVKINGVTLGIVSWGSSSQPVQQIICDLPREAYGNVQVEVGARFSNVLQLTKWELTLVSKTRIPAAPPSSGQHNIDISATFIIRSCINNSFTNFASVSRASTGNFDASGSITNPSTPSVPTQTITYSSLSPQFRIDYPGDTVDPATDKFSATNISCSASRDSGGIKLLYSIAGVYKVTDTIGSSTTMGEQGTGYATNTYFDTSQSVLFFLDGGFNIAGGQMTAKNNPNSTLEWQTASAFAPPVN